MDNKILFVRTSKGEDEMQSRTSHLPGDVKRALLMVDGFATFGEISKRAAPSMRASLGEMFRELEKSGFIQNKDVVGKSPKIAVPSKMSVQTKMSVPAKMATPQKKQTVEDDGGELDFLTGFPVSPPEAPAIVPDNVKNLRVAAEENSKKEIDAAKIKAQREAAAILHNAEQDAAKIREETARRANEEATRLKAEQEAKRARNELESNKLKNDQESKLSLEAAIKEQQQTAEAVRSKATHETKKARDEFDAARIKAEQEAKLSLEAASKAREQAEAAHVKAEQEAQKVRDEIEAAKLKAEQEAQRVLDELEAARLIAEQAAKRVRDEIEAARLKAEQEAKLRLEAAAREREQAEAARVKAEQEAAQMHIELEATRLRAEQEAKARLEAAAKAHARIKAEEEGAAKAQVAAELIAKQAREAAQATEAVPAAKKPDAFAFDAFQIDEPQRSAEPHKEYQPAQQVSAAQQPSDIAKTIQPADVRQPVKQQVPPPAASEPVESKPSQEQIKRKAQERIADEQRIVAEAQAKQQGDAQAKVWAEAEQRALEVAKANAERVAHQAEYPVADTRHVEKPTPVARIRRKPFAWGRLVGFVFKLGVFLLVLLAGVLFVVPYVLPMRDYMPKVQQLLSTRLHQPVHIGYLSGRILPTPRLELGEIYIGEVKQFQAKEAQINFEITGFFGDKKPIGSVEFKDVKVSGAGLQNATAWLQQLAKDDQYPVSRMVISQGTLDADAFQLTGVEGELNFSPVGKFTQANLRANAGKFTLGINATPENKLQVAITVRASALPLLPNWSFDEMNAKGVLSKDELQISDFDARILGGVVHGNANINWRSGWRAQGALSAKTITMQKLSKLLDGNAEGSARFKMTSVDLAGLADSMVLDGSFMATNGMISGMDIVETARMHSRENLHGGRTHFDGLSGVISYANNIYHFKQVKVAAGVLNATATFDVTKQQLSGKMNVSLSMHDGIAPVDLQMGGAIDNPTLRYAP